MSEGRTAGRAAARSGAGEPRVHKQRRIAALDPRRKLQLALGALWLLDGILQYQPSMFTKSFPQMLADSADGNPALVAAPITWSATFIEHHLIVLNALFATVQVALGLGIVYRPTVKLALGASVAWSLGVWWLGEGFGGILADRASPLAGAPGAVILYAVLAVLLWPADRDASAPFVAGVAAGRRVARVLWLAVWGSLAAFALLPASRAPNAVSGTLSGMSSAQPAWLAWVGSHAAAALRGQGLPVSVLLAVLLLTVAAAVFLPPRLSRPVLVLALVLAAVLWLAQGMGGLFTGATTDPNSAPLLALLVLAFWPTAPRPGPAALAAPAGER